MASICYTSAEEAWLMLGSPGLLSSSRMLISNWEWVSFLEISKVQKSSIPSVPLPRPQMELGELHIHLKKFQRWLWYAFPVKYFFEMVSILWKSTVTWASQVGLVVKNPSANVEDIRDAGSVPGLGRSLGEGHGNPLQYSCLENPMDRGAWRVTIPRVAKSQIQLKRQHTHEY